MAVNNTLAPTNGQQRKLTFSQALQVDDKITKLVKGALTDPKRASRFCAALVSTVAANPLLQECEFVSVVSAALQGEALELSSSPTLGEYYLVPYKKSVLNPETGKYEKITICQFQIGTAGRLQLAMRSGQFKSLYAIEIREGEYRGRNSENAQPLFVFEKDDDKRERLPIIGFLGFYELTNGFRHSVYFSKEKCLNWAEKYSKAFDRKLYEKVQKGIEITDWKEKASAEAPWYKHTDEMCKNLVLRRVLKNAPKSIEMRNLLDIEERNENELAQVITPIPVVTQETVEKEFFTDETITDVSDEKTTLKKSAEKTEQMSLLDDNK